LKTKIQQKPEDMKLLAKDDKNARKCQKYGKKWICKALHRGHDDSHRAHRATMGTDLAPKKTEQIF
jgi:hypothetical protein